MFKGSIPALITPFSNNRVDLNSFKKLITWQIDQGSHALVVCGTTGEAFLLTDEERTLLVKEAIATANKKAPIIVGCGHLNPDQVITYVNEAAALGADGALVVAPYYIRPSESALYDYFKKIHDETTLPLILYNNPGRCTINMSVDLINRIMKLDRYVSLKDSCNDMGRILDFEIPSGKTLLSGDDMTAAAHLSLGGDGWISVTANVAPALCAQAYNTHKAGNRDEFLDICKKLHPLHKAMGVETNPTPAKYALSTMGYCENKVRAPLTKISKESEQIVDNTLSNF